MGSMLEPLQKEAVERQRAADLQRRQALQQSQSEALSGLRQAQEGSRQLSNSADALRSRLKSLDDEALEGDAVGMDAMGEDAKPQLMGGFVCDSPSGAQPIQVPEIRRVPKAKVTLDRQIVDGRWDGAGDQAVGWLGGKLGDGLTWSGKAAIEGAKVLGAGAHGAAQAAGKREEADAGKALAYQNSQRAQAADIRSRLANGQITQEEARRRYAALAADAEKHGPHLVGTSDVLGEAVRSQEARDGAQQQLEKDYGVAKGAFGWLDGAGEEAGSAYTDKLKRQRAENENYRRQMQIIRELRAGDHQREADENEKELKAAIRRQNETAGFGTGTSEWRTGLRAAASERALSTPAEIAKDYAVDKVAEKVKEKAIGSIGDEVASKVEDAELRDHVARDGDVLDLYHAMKVKPGEAKEKAEKFAEKGFEVAEKLSEREAPERSAEPAYGGMGSSQFFPDCAAARGRR